jgi:hypothetical protein
MRTYEPIAYVYDGAHHCPGCAVKVFGQDPNGLVPEVARDREGKELGSIAAWDEWYQVGKGTQLLVCADCGDEIDSYEEER